MMEKGNYRHFMEKEIHDQPEGCQRTISAYVDALTARTAMPGDLDFKAWSASRSSPAAPPTSPA
jgi:glucosamine--fructose-6-phosphate aminotransferase (isomerizing)